MSIVIENLTYTYSPKSPFEKKALDDISLTIEEGEFFGIIGHTGCGKSTLISHLNGLTRVQAGRIAVGDVELGHKKLKKAQLRQLRATVGLVFQYPEYQLFSETVLEDVSFGPKNLKLSSQEVLERAKEAIQLVGLDFESIKERSPFDLSGGQKRRVAIAGVLAMRPKILILDEPTSGLDPKGKKEIIGLIQHVQKNMCPTVIMISHNMDEVAAVSDRIAVLSSGKLATVQTPESLFSQSALLEELGIAMPLATQFAHTLCQNGIAVDRSVVTQDALVEEILKSFSSVIGEDNSYA